MIGEAFDEHYELMPTDKVSQLSEQLREAIPTILDSAEPAFASSQAQQLKESMSAVIRY